MSKRKKTSPAQAPEAPVEEQDGETTRAEMPAEVIERAVSEEGSPLGDEPPAPEPAAAAEQPVIEPEAPSRRARRTRGRAPKDTVPDETAVPEASAEAQEPARLVDPEAVVAEESAPAEPAEPYDLDAETTVNLSGDMLPLPGRDDLDAPTVAATGEELAEVDGLLVQRKHLRGLLESLVFASDTPIKSNELAKLASAPLKHVKELLGELKDEYATRGIHLDEVAGGWVFRTSAQYAPFIRDLTKQKPVRLTRAQVETLAIIAYRQPITRPEVDDVRGVDSGPVLKLLLERDLVRILGKRDEPGRPLIYGTTTNFLEFFGLKSLKDLPTLREFTELTDESRQTYEDELGETPNEGPAPNEGVEGDSLAEAAPAPEAEPTEGAGSPHESMRVPIGDDVIDEALNRELEETHSAVRHEADQDDATITSNAPLAEDVEP